MNKRYLLIGALVLSVALLISAFSLEAITGPYESEHAQTGGSSSLQVNQFPGAGIYPQLYAYHLGERNMLANIPVSG